ncbi:MAG: GreA/GreB family elongation factor [Hyphomicrobiales bacterium]|nr:GreA/GreB family elongation factor [Hyphomicrobiales bacterium]
MTTNMRGMMISHLDPRLPPIAVKASEIDLLWNVAEHGSSVEPRASAFLKNEIGRAEILLEPRVLRGLVTMNCSVSFRDVGSSEEMTVELVFPEAANEAAGRISVLSPLGASLLGMSVGQAIQFADERGVRRTIVVTAAIPLSRS